MEQCFMIQNDIYLLFVRAYSDLYIKQLILKVHKFIDPWYEKN